MGTALKALCLNQVRLIHAAANITRNSVPLDYKESDPSRNATTTYNPTSSNSDNSCDSGIASDADDPNPLSLSKKYP